MFLAVNHTIGTLKCELILHLSADREPTSFSSGSAFTASRLVSDWRRGPDQQWGVDRLNGLALVHVHDINSGAVANISKMGPQWSQKNWFSFLQITARP